MAAACGATPGPVVEPRRPAERADVVVPADPCEGVAAPVVELGMGCVPAEGGSWRVLVSDVHEAECTACYQGEDEVATEGTFQLAFVRSDGSRALDEPAAFHQEEAEHVTVTALAAYDFDGDGASELVVRIDVAVHEGGDASTAILTTDGEWIVPYAPADSFAEAVSAVRDLDEDGRPDIVSYAPWSTGGFGFSEEGGSWSGGPRSLFHSLDDGTFSSDDGVARAFLDQECVLDGPLVPPLDVDEWGPDELTSRVMKNVTCAALRGTEADVLAAFEAGWDAAPCGGDDWQDFCERLQTRARARIHAAASR